MTSRRSHGAGGAATGNDKVVGERAHAHPRSVASGAMDEAQGGPPGTGGRAPRGSGIPVGRILGVPVSLTVPWLLLSALITVGYGELVSRRQPDLPTAFAYLIGLALVGCLLGSVLLHELGHALLARRHGVPVRRVTLDLLGG